VAAIPPVSLAFLKIVLTDFLPVCTFSRSSWVAFFLPVSLLMLFSRASLPFTASYMACKS